MARSAKLRKAVREGVREAVHGARGAALPRMRTATRPQGSTKTEGRWSAGGGGGAQRGERLGGRQQTPHEGLCTLKYQL